MLIRISGLIRDAYVRDAFERAEKDMGGALAVPQDRPPRILPPFGAAIISNRELVAQD